MLRNGRDAEPTLALAAGTEDAAQTGAQLRNKNAATKNRQSRDFLFMECPFPAQKDTHASTG